MWSAVGEHRVKYGSGLSARKHTPTVCGVVDLFEWLVHAVVWS